MRPLLLAALLLPLAACERDDPVATVGAPFCVAAVTLAVSGGTTPTIGWTPACRVTRVSVIDGADTVWFIRHLDGLEPGLRYGEAPYGAQIFRDARPLVAGRSYDVRAWLIRNDTTYVYGAAAYVP